MARYTDAEDRAIIELTADGMSQHEIARVTGRSSSSVHYRVKWLRTRGMIGEAMRGPCATRRAHDYWPISRHEDIPWQIVITGRDQSVGIGAIR